MNRRIPADLQAFNRLESGLLFKRFIGSSKEDEYIAELATVGLCVQHDLSMLR